MMSRLVSTALALTLAACLPSRASVWNPTDAEIERRLGIEAHWGTSPTDPRVPAAVAKLLKAPLDRDAAVRIAVVNNRRLQARYDELGIAAAAIARATVLPPTEVDLSYKTALDGDGSELELEVVQDLLDLVEMPRRRDIAEAELAAARARAVAATVELVARVEMAFNDLLAAQMSLELRQTAFDAADASADLVERMHAAGNTTDLALARERDQREQARLELARAQLEVEETREAMNGVLGLSGDDTRWNTVPRLPELSETPPSLDDLERTAIAASLALEALTAEADSAAGRLGQARLRAFLPELGVGVGASRGDGEWDVGPAIRFGLPIFDRQQGPRAAAKADLRRAQNEATATAVELRATARAARQRVLEAHAEARHLRDVVLPLRQSILDETLKQYNAMNASTLELLMAKRELVDAGRQYIDALRRFWNATAEASALSRGASVASTPSRSIEAAAASTGEH
jgi:cobalt-zinc-cadmium efflux system outer membrane protein